MKPLNWRRKKKYAIYSIFFFLSCALFLSCSEPQHSLYNQANLLEARWNYYNQKMQDLEVCLAKSDIISSQVRKEIRKIKKSHPNYNHLLDTLQKNYIDKTERINNLHATIHKTYEEAGQDKALYNEFLKQLLDGDYERGEARAVLSKYEKKLEKYERKLISYQKRVAQYTYEHDVYIDVIKARVDIFNGDKIKCDIKID